MPWILATGAPWRDLPERYDSCRTVYNRFSLWSRDGILNRTLAGLNMRLDELGLIDWEPFFIDGSVIRASRAASGAGEKNARANP